MQTSPRNRKCKRNIWKSQTRTDLEVCIEIYSTKSLFHRKPQTSEGFFEDFMETQKKSKTNFLLPNQDIGKEKGSGICSLDFFPPNIFSEQANQNQSMILQEQRFYKKFPNSNKNNSIENRWIFSIRTEICSDKRNNEYSQCFFSVQLPQQVQKRSSRRWKP